tara:strand:+ start:522 stop:1010 length:489 start_codon:yes stop_codon:yes gene_type:complete
MNVYLKLNDIKLNPEKHIDLYDNIRYLYPKKNTIMDGEFTKILYSKNYVTMNGLYLYIPLSVSERKNVENIHCRYMNMNNKQNLSIIHDLKTIEKVLLQNYKQYNNTDKHFELVLSKQLATGQIRVYHENSHKQKINNYVIKISGIWETSNKIGLTYKILEL